MPINPYESPRHQTASRKPPSWEVAIGGTCLAVYGPSIVLMVALYRLGFPPGRFEAVLLLLPIFPGMISGIIVGNGAFVAAPLITVAMLWGGSVMSRKGWPALMVTMALLLAGNSLGASLMYLIAIDD